MSKISGAPSGTGLEKARITNAKRRAMASLESISDDEDVALTAAAESDPDNPPADDLMRRKVAGLR